MNLRLTEVCYRSASSDDATEVPEPLLVEESEKEVAKAQSIRDDFFNEADLDFTALSSDHQNGPREFFLSASTESV
jgi:hypothetical protein